MLIDIITSISESFIKEAQSSPQLLSDMASMERYMAESYCGRVFVEMLQNADDCGSKHMLIEQINNDLFIANDGHPFTENDVISISRSGASNKERGSSIGYRGIGFKSTSYLTDEIIIHSDNTSFTFSKSLCSKVLNINSNNVPTIRIPLPIDVSNEINECISRIKNRGFNTIFIFRNAKINEFIEEVKSVNNGFFLFLNNILCCSFELSSFSSEIEIVREPTKDGQLVKFVNEPNIAWLIYDNGCASVGFKYDISENCIIECKEPEQLFHCYLPTYDKVTFPIKVNSDFSTDPSRKHITVDENTDNAILKISELLFDIVQNALNGLLSPKYREVLSILNKHSVFSKCNELLRHKFKEILLNRCTLQLNNGDIAKISDYKLLPNWLEPSEIYFLRTNSSFVNDLSLSDKIYKEFESVDSFISQFSPNTFSNEEIISIMTETSVVEKMTAETQGKILGKVIKSEMFTQSIGESYGKDIGDINLLTGTGVVRIKDICSSNAIIDESVSKSLRNSIGNDGLAWFERKYQINPNQIFDNAINPKIAEDKPVNVTIKPHVSKWRTAEQQCIEIEKSFGNSAIDVSKKNIGYDIESVTPKGEKRFIEVKSIKNEGEFSITNNEYTAAHQYGENYYLCLMIQDDKRLKVIYINNPLEKLQFEKRIRQWEWVCDAYKGDMYTFEF